MLNTMLANRQVTPQGVDWLTLATDPFHDTEISPVGFPDADCSRSIPQMYQFTGTLSAPTVLPTTTWDAQLSFCPVSFGFGGVPNVSAPLTRGTLTPAGLLTAGSNGFGFQGGYNFYGMAASTNTINGAAVGTLSGVNGISYPAAASSGQFRLVAAGVEVVNTTADLYRGGSVTCYRSPNVQRQGFYIAVGPNPGLNCSYISLPPGTQAEAQLYPASRTWGAEDGCYLVATMDSSVNDYSSAAPGAVIAMSPFDTPTLVSGGNTTVFYTNATGGGSGANCHTVMPFDWSGAIFTGLTPQTTLQVTVRYYVERIPTITQPDLLVLTRNPCPYDPVALEIYSRCLSELPVGVRVSENPLGEWFNEIMDTVATWAPRIGAGLGSFIPGGAAIGTAVGAGAQALGRLNRNGDSKPSQRKPTPKKDESVTNKGTQNRTVSTASKRRKPRNVKKKKRNN